MKVDAIRRTFYSAKNSLRKISEKNHRNTYTQEEIKQMPTTQVWDEIKSLADSLTNRFAK